MAGLREICLAPGSVRDSPSRQARMMQAAADFLGMAQPPADLVAGPAQFFRHGTGHARHIEDGMALEDLRQSVGQIAGKTFSGTLMQLKGQFRLPHFLSL